MSAAAHDNAGVVAHPPLLYLAGLIAAGALEWVVPLSTGLLRAPMMQMVLGGLAFAAALVIVAIAFKTFTMAGTNVPTHLPSTTVVTHGLYRYSRNPIYIALTLAYCGLALIFNVWWAFIVLPAVIAVMYYGVISREEAYLERKFGADYLAYKAKVRRWL